MMIYPRLSCFEDRPNEAIRYLIGRNLDSLIKICITEATEFINTSAAKSKALDQLKYTLLIGESQITKHVQTLVKALVRISHLEIQNSHQKITQIVETIGYHVKSEYYIPLMLDILAQEQYKNSTKNTVVLLNLLSHMLLTSEGLQNHTEMLLKALKHYEALFQDNDQGILSLYEISATLINRLETLSSTFTQIVFSIIINVQAAVTIALPKRQQAVKCMELLAKKSGYASMADLHANQVGPFLTQLIKTKQYTSWNKVTRQRFKFDTIVRNCHSQVSRFLPEIFVVFEYLINPQNDLQTRMDTLVLIEKIMTIEELREALRGVSQQLIRKVLIVAMQWKVGKPQIKIRKAGVINLITLIDRKLIKEYQLLNCFKQLFPHLKSCISDDWAPELRLACCQFLEKYLLATKQIIGDEELKQLYLMILQRLDDSQDPIRKKITIAINVFFNCRNLRFSSSTLQYMIGAIFVHFDDNSEEIQDAVLISLRHAALVDAKLVLKNAEINVKKMKNKQRCKELIEFCTQRIDQYKLQP